FVFDLITSCFYKKKGKNDLTILLNYKKQLSKNTSLLEISKFNFMSRLLLSHKRKRWEIRKNWQFLFPVIGIILLGYSSFKLIKLIPVDWFDFAEYYFFPYLMFVLYFVGIFYFLLKTILFAINKLESKWLVNQRSRIYKDSEISNKRARLLIHLIQYLKPKNILEIGTGFGINTVVLSSAQRNSKITTMDENEQVVNAIKEMFKKNTIKNVKFLAGNFNITLPRVFNNNTYDFIHFKGSCVNKTILKYFESSLLSIDNNSVFLFENIHSNKESEKVWNYIKKHEKVTVTIDTLLWGFVFFRKEQEKEHFIIRI
ncbi:MAG: class I SAM-dependent methyltransferase, partial [Flavobacteriaceae bacterium]|nr:class I SAM-dependent methyltransferase [Flavobacteriaceae bacterium]